MIDRVNDDVRAVRLSCAEAARYLNLSERQLERMRHERRGPKFFRPVGMKPFYLQSDLDDYLRTIERSQVRPLPASPR